jgi:hypothetical protein
MAAWLLALLGLCLSLVLLVIYARYLYIALSLHIISYTIAILESERDYIKDRTKHGRKER